MRKELALVYNILGIEDTYQEITNHIEQNPNHRIISSHPLSFIFHGYQQRLNNKITKEEFIRIGDINNIDIKKNNFTNEEIINNLKYKIKNKIKLQNNTIILNKIENKQEIIDDLAKKIENTKNRLFTA